MAAALAASALLAACGGGSSTDFRAGGADAQKAVEGFLDGWISASGPRNDTITASQTRRFLGCELGELVAGTQVGGGQQAKRVEVIFNEVMLLPFPPDNRYEVVESNSTETNAVFRVKLNYTANAASLMAAQGLIPFNRVQEVHDQVIGGPERVLYLEKSEERGWQICAVEEP